MAYRISVDTGGTFTDVVVSDDSGRLTMGKALSTPERVFDGMRNALAVVAETGGVTVGDLLGDASMLIYGTTRATNAIVQGTTAKTGLVVTRGFRDILLLREGGKENPFDFKQEYAGPYVPPWLTVEVTERIDAEGDIVTPLDEEQSREALRGLRSSGVEAVAVCLLWSVANPSHELRLAELIEAELGPVPYTLSHDLNPIVREYRRASSASIDASLKPVMQHHLAELGDDLRANGFQGELLAATALGGVTDWLSLVDRPIYAIKSGPAMAPVGGLAYANGERSRHEDVIVCDTGGTTFDVTLARSGVITSTRETWLGERYGQITGLSAVDVRSIGAGGGSIAWIDTGGLLRVGPQSAGADPGPACYGLGGDKPTVTDAALLLGYIDPDYFLGGRMQLDVAAAERAVGAFADQLGTGVEEAAHAILTVVNEQMVRAIQEITVNEGVDPRQALLVAGGGASGLNIVPIARELGCATVVVPRMASALSACGIQYSDLISEFGVSRFARSRSFDYEAVNEALARIDRQAERFAEGLRGRGILEFTTSYSVEARYAYQLWELEVQLAKGRFDGPEDLEDMVSRCDHLHERNFAVTAPGQELECVYWRGRTRAHIDKPAVGAGATNGSQPTATSEKTRRTFFPETGTCEAPIYIADDLRPGVSIPGPAIVEEATTTIVVQPNSTAVLDTSDRYVLTVDV